VVEIPRLIALSLRIGVGQSVKVLKKQKGLVRKMISARPYRPNDLLDGISLYLDDPELDIPGFHLFSFNNIERTERWRVETFEKLNGAGE
jgi:methylenetetrahydrofolate reductase (NADPH)